MKDFFKVMIFGYLRLLVRMRLLGVRADVVGITGSVGKTTTKDAAASILQQNFNVFKTPSSYNTDIGMVLALLGQKSGFTNPLKWTATMIGATWKAFAGRRHFEKMVIEYGIDSPGDMDKLTKILKPNVGIFLNVKPVHLADGQFENLDAIYEEKKKLILGLPEEGWALINADDEYGQKLIQEIKEDAKEEKYKFQVVTFGINNKAHIMVEDVVCSEKGLSFYVKFGEETKVVHLPKLIAKHEIYNLMPAVLCGFLSTMKWEKIEAGLKAFQLPKGRMSLLDGINGSRIIDSSYNANPASVASALEVLGEFKSEEGRKIAALGTMNELGERSAIEHRKIGKQLPEYADMLVAVGEGADSYASGAKEAGLEENKIRVFDNSEDAASFLARTVQAGDTVLAKGSQNNVRMERVVKAIMAEPGQAKQTLVRQGDEWLNT